MNFYKPILLPSNNVVYDSIIEIKEADLSFLIGLKTLFLDSSENDLIYSIIKKYTNIKDPKKIYYKDAQYIYFLFLSFLNKNDELLISNICENCNNNVKIKINLSEFKTKYATKEDFKDKEYKIKDFTFIFRNRLFEDNIKSGIINFENKEETLDNIINFLKPQCVKIIYQDNEFDNSSLKEALLEIGLTKTMTLFEELRSESWGIDSFFFYNCKNCKHKNKAYISDPYRSSSYYISENSFNDLEILELVIQLSSFKVLTYSELLSIPISLWEPTTNYISEIIKKK